MCIRDRAVDLRAQTQGLNRGVLVVGSTARHVHDALSERTLAAAGLEPALRGERCLELGEPRGGEPLLDLVQELLRLLHTLAYNDDSHAVSYTHLRAHETGRNLVC